MNSYLMMDQPAAPPRRKRSLSTSRSDHMTLFQDPPGLAFQSNRIGRRNYSTDHIPGGYSYSAVSKPFGSTYNSGSQQALSGSLNYTNGMSSGYDRNLEPKYQKNFNYKNQNLTSFSQQYTPTHMQQSHMQPQSHQHSSFGIRQSLQQLQPHLQQDEQIFNGSNSNQFRRSISSDQQMPIPQFMNPYAVPSSKVVPVRAHQDYLKYAQPNVHYNPYQSQFSPTLMARPDIHPFQKVEQNRFFQKRDRSPFSSREQLDIVPQTPPILSSGPQRPPPPKFQNSDRLSVENLSTPSASDYEAHLNSQLRDRRSISPTRFSPSSQMFQSQQQQLPQLQRSYTTSGRHSTSPLPSSNGVLSSQENRYGSRNMLNSTGYVGNRITSSRETSPYTRSGSPFGRTTSQFSSNTSVCLDSPSFKFTNRTYSYSNSLSSSSRKLDRSISYFGSNTNFENNRYDGSISIDSSLEKLNVTPRSAMASTDCKDKSNELVTKNIDHNNCTENLSCSDNSAQASSTTMDSLQVPTSNSDSLSAMHQQNHQQNPQFSQAFTDHCDQYKSVTSKILGKNNKINRNSGEYNDLYNEVGEKNLLQQQEQQLMQQSDLDDEFTYDLQRNNMLSSEGRQDLYPDDKKAAIEKQLLNSSIPPLTSLPSSSSASRSRNNSLTFGDNIGSLSQSQENSDNCEQLRKSPTPSRGQTSRRNSIGSTCASRKGSLPSDYLSHPDTYALSKEWSREKVANLAHEARQRAHNPPSNDALKKVGVWLTKQFVFLLIAAVNVMIAYAFYNLFTMLPADI